MKEASGPDARTVAGRLLILRQVFIYTAIAPPADMQAEVMEQ